MEQLEGCWFTTTLPKTTWCVFSILFCRHNLPISKKTWEIIRSCCKFGTTLTTGNKISSLENKGFISDTWSAIGLRSCFPSFLPEFLVIQWYYANFQVNFQGRNVVCSQQFQVIFSFSDLWFWLDLKTITFWECLIIRSLKFCGFPPVHLSKRRVEWSVRNDDFEDFKDRDPNWKFWHRKTWVAFGDLCRWQIHRQKLKSKSTPYKSVRQFTISSQF